MHEFLLSHLSMLGEHAGRGAEALAYADRALAEDPPSRRVRAMLKIRRARALGLLGATAEALAEWETARRLLMDGAEHGAEDKITYWLHDSELAIHRAVILARGERTTEAVQWSQRGVELPPARQGRDQVLFRAMLLENTVAAGAWEDAAQTATDLAGRPALSGSARVPKILRLTLARLERREHRAPAVVRDAVRAAAPAGYHSISLPGLTPCRQHTALRLQ